MTVVLQQVFTSRTETSLRNGHWPLSPLKDFLARRKYRQPWPATRTEASVSDSDKGRRIWGGRNKACKRGPCRRFVIAHASQPSAIPGVELTPTKREQYKGVLLLLLANIGVFLANNVLKVPWTRSLYLYHAAPQLASFITCAFCHANWEHLSSNMFLLLIFGKAVEEEEGAFGLWVTYIVTALGASLASFFLLPTSSISMGASGAVFGLFAVSILTRLKKLDLRLLLEGAILGNFVVQQVLQEMRAQSAVMAGRGAASVGGAQVAHVAHLAGAIAGVLLVLAVNRLPVLEQRQAGKKPS